MKRLLIALTAVSLLTGTAALAAPQHNGPSRNGHYDTRANDTGSGHRHHWRRGERVPMTLRLGHEVDWSGRMAAPIVPPRGRF
jgi:Ni/Co efflux regulator RcnB